MRFDREMLRGWQVACRQLVVGSRRIGRWIALALLTAACVVLATSFFLYLRIPVDTTHAWGIEKGTLVYETGVAMESGLPLTFAVRWEWGSYLHLENGSFSAQFLTGWARIVRFQIWRVVLILSLVSGLLWYPRRSECVLRVGDGGLRTTAEARHSQEPGHVGKMLLARSPRFSVPRAVTVSLTYAAIVFCMSGAAVVPMSLNLKAAELISESGWTEWGILMFLIAPACGHGRMMYLVSRWRFSTDALCRRCGYNLTGNESGRCPECGAKCDAHMSPTPVSDITPSK